MGRIISPVKKKINDHNPLFTARLDKKVNREINLFVW